MAPQVFIIPCKITFLFVHVSNDDFVLIETIDRLLDGKIFPCTGTLQAIAQSQKRIRWMPIFLGFWSHKWLHAHISHVNAASLRDPKDQEQRSKNQDRWLKKVSSFVMRQCHQLWLLRNNKPHGVTPAEKATALCTTAECELAQPYNRRAGCEPRHHLLFCTTLADHVTISPTFETGYPCTHLSFALVVIVTAKAPLSSLPVHKLQPLPGSVQMLQKAGLPLLGGHFCHPWLEWLA
jgi:hypothetical protein